VSDEKQYTQRELVTYQRGAYVHGRIDGADEGAFAYRMYAEQVAAEKYPLPKETRYRKVVLSRGHTVVAMRNGDFDVYRPDGSREWGSASAANVLGAYVYTVDDARALLDLHDNPTEEVQP
jgi:hypothetical protein